MHKSLKWTEILSYVSDTGQDGIIQLMQWQLKNYGLIPDRTKDFFFFSTVFRLGLMTTQSPFQWVMVALCPYAIMAYAGTTLH